MKNRCNRCLCALPILLGALWLPATAATAADRVKPTACAPGVVASVTAMLAADNERGKIGGLVSSVCKVWPHDRQVWLTAMVFNGDADGGKLLVVATVATATGRVLASYQNSVGEDAATEFGPDSLAIDSAPYQLSPAVRAFGIRFNSSARGASCPDGIWGDELTLFIPRGKVLLPVLRGMAMARSEAREGCFGGASPTLIYDDARLSLDIAGSASHGLADLQVNARIVRNEPGKDLVGKPQAARAILRFDGTQYRLVGQQPWWLLQFPLGE